MPRKLGQSLTEYGLIVVLVAILSVAGLQVLGGNTLDALRQVSPDGTAQASQLSLPPGTNGPAPGTSAQASSSQGSPSQAPGASITLSSGTVITYSPASRDIGGSVATSGANGSTEMLLGSLESLAHSLLASGEISQADADSLLALANQGHRMAAVEKIIEESAAKAGSADELYHMPVQWDGKTMELWELSMTIDMQWPQLDWKELVSDPANRSDSEIGKFVTIYQGLQGSGFMQDPAIAGAVTDLTGKIASLAEITEDGVSKTMEKSASPSDMLDLMASTASDLYSADICTTGGNQDSGQNCS